MSYHRFNNLSKVLNGDLATKIGRGVYLKQVENSVPEQEAINLIRYHK